MGRRDLSLDQQFLPDVTRPVVHLRRKIPVPRRRRSFARQSNDGLGNDLEDIKWFNPLSRRYCSKLAVQSTPAL